MPTEKTETEMPKSIDEAWDEDIELEDETEGEEKIEGEEVAESEKVDEDGKDEPDSEAKEDSEQDDGSEEEQEKVDWKALGLGMFEGKTQKEVAEQISFERKQLGHTTNMIGDLRREIAQLKTNSAEKEKPAEKPKDVLSGIRDLDEADVAKFNVMYEKNPIKAIMTYGGDAIKQVVAEEVKKNKPDVSGVLQQTADQMKYDSFLESHPDVTNKDLSQMKIFDDEQYLGVQGRSYADLYGLAKLWHNRDDRAEAIYSLMKKHATMSFSEACEFVPKPEEKPVDTEKIKKTVNKNKKTTTRTHAVKQAEVVRTGKTVDEVWDNFED